MTQNDLLFLLLAESSVTAVYAAVATFQWHKQHKNYHWALKVSDNANQNYRRYRASINEAKDALQKQLEAAEKKWGEAQTQIDYDKREMQLFLGRYKLLENEKIRSEELLMNAGKKYRELEHAYNLLISNNDPHALPM